MPNTKDLKIDNIKLKCLVYGNSGTGKTTFASTFPKPYFFDFDGGVLSLRGKDVEYDTYTDVYEGNKRIKSAWRDFQNMLDDVPDKFETLVIDSITTLEDYAMHELLELNKKKEPDIKEWYRLTLWLTNFFAIMNGLDKHIVVIAHEQIVKDEITGEVMIRPLIVGKKLPVQMPLFFDEVYRMEVAKDRKSGDVSYQLITKAATKYTAKSRLGVLDDVEVADYQVIANKMKGGGK